MRVSKIKISNILGLDELEIKPGKVTVISGENASGKTSIIEAIKAIFEGGHDATLLRAGAENGEVVLLLDDGIQIRKTISKHGSELSVKHPEMGKIGKPAAYIKKLAASLSVNPIEFLVSTSDRRVDALLSAIPMELSSQDLVSIVPEEYLDGIDTEGHALKVLDKIHRSVYDGRTGVNRAIKEKRATISQMSEQLPELLPGEWESILSSTKDKLAKTRSDISKRLRFISDKFSQRTTSILEECIDRESVIRIRLAEGIERLRMEADLEIAQSTAQKDKALSDIYFLQESEEDAVKNESAKDIETMISAIAEADKMSTLAKKAESAREWIAKLSKECESLDERAKSLTDSLEAVEAKKTSLLSDKMPIKGLEVRDGQIYINGIQFERVNDSAKITIALAIASLIAEKQKLPLILADGLEKFDDKTFALFEQEAAKTNFQFIVTRVEGEELDIQVKETY